MQQCPMAAPTPTRRLFAQTGLDGIESDIAQELRELGVGPHEHGTKALLKQMAAAGSVPAIELVCVMAAELMHPLPERRLRRFDHQMKVVLHQAIRQAIPLMARGCPRQFPQEEEPISVVTEDSLLTVAPIGDVMDPACELDAR